MPDLQLRTYAICDLAQADFFRAARTAAPSRIKKIPHLGRGGRCLALLEAFATENRTSLGRPEGYGSFLAAGRAVGAGFGALIVAAATVVAGRPYLPRPLGLARFTAFRLVLELFIVEKKLLARREDEVRAAVHALQNPILEFH